MREEKRKKIVVLVIILLDQILKFLSLRLGFGGLNYGASWGLFPQWPNLVFVIINLLFLLVLWRFRKAKGIWLMTTGGAGNLIDRILRGGVVDFIKLPLIPDFNLADFFICLGFGLLLVDFVKTKKLS